MYQRWFGRVGPGVVVRSFPGHEGRPGQRGGSVPKGGTHTGSKTNIRDQEWAENSAKEWQGSLSKEESKSIRDYQGAKSRIINGVLRKDVAVDDEERTAKRIDAITSALNRGNMPDDVTVWRGFGSNRAGNEFGKLQIGDDVTDKGFASTSLVKDWAVKEFGSHGAVAAAIIHIPKGSKAAYIGGLETMPGQWEGEILIQRGSRYKVKGFIQYKDKTLISLELLDSKPQKFFRTQEEWEQAHGY